MLFPELSPVVIGGLTQDVKTLEEQVRLWVDTLPETVSKSFSTSEVVLNNIIVNYNSGTAENSKELQERKAAMLEEGKELYFVYPWELESLSKMFSHFNSRLSLDERKFAAKRLLLEKIPNKEADNFMRENHIQGAASGAQKVSYGLRVKGTGELLAAQQYCKSRWMLKKASENAGVWEGLRLAIKSNTQVYGAATRLQKEFLREYNPTELMSYVDYSHSLGSYKAVQGFTQNFASRESFMWCLAGEPVNVEIVDKDGVLRTPDLELVKKTPYVNPNIIAGAFGKGIGQTFYGGKLGSRAQLRKHEENGELVHNDAILEAIGYVRVYTAGQLKWSKAF